MKKLIAAAFTVVSRLLAFSRPADGGAGLGLTNITDFFHALVTVLTSSGTAAFLAVLFDAVSSTAAAFDPTKVGMLVFIIHLILEMIRRYTHGTDPASVAPVEPTTGDPGPNPAGTPPPQ